MDKQRDVVTQADASIAAQRAAVATAQAQLATTRYQLELTAVRAPADGRIVRRYANPGSGASTLNVSTMFDLEPNTARIVRAELAESDLPNVTLGQAVEIVPDADPLHPAHGTVIRRAYQFGARKLLSDDPSERTDERVVEVVANVEGAQFLIGQRVLVKFLKPGRKAPVAAAPVKTGVAGPEADAH